MSFAKDSGALHSANSENNRNCSYQIRLNNYSWEVLICSKRNVVIEDFIQDGHKYYGKVLNGHGNLYVQSCIMEKIELTQLRNIICFLQEKM